MASSILVLDGRRGSAEISMLEEFVPRNFKPQTLEIIDRVNLIIEEYRANGYVMTLRQIFYQLVRRNWIKNQQSEYKRLGSIVNDARLAGLIDWSMIEDITRNVRSVPMWTSPEDIMKTVVAMYKEDPWDRQPNHVEVWIEKDALLGVIAGICENLRVPYLSCRGYLSQSEAYEAGNRLSRAFNMGQNVVVLHLGDHDPSGLDMSRDLQARLNMFCRDRIVEVDRLALNMDQIERFRPPPNPAKEKDIRLKKYRQIYGNSSWELDSLDPTEIANIIETAVINYRDDDLWDQAIAAEEAPRAELRDIAGNWAEALEAARKAAR